MSNEEQIEKFRILWEQLMIGSKLEVCADELKGSGILDVNILRLLYSDSEIIPKEIAKKLKIPNSTLTNAINRLVKKGLLERKLNSSDLRSLQLVLTDKGKKAIGDHHNAERVLIGNILGILDENESQSLIKIFEKIVTIL